MFRRMAARRKGQKQKVPALVRSAHAGFLSQGTGLQGLLSERAAMIRLMNEVAAACHAAEPMDVPKGHGADAVAKLMKDSGFKFAYAQRIAEIAQDSVTNVRKQFGGRLRGAMRNVRVPVDEAASEKDPVWSRLVDLEPWTISEEDAAGLRTLAKDDENWLSAFAPGGAGMSDGQRKLAGAIRGFAMSRYACPRFNEVGTKASDTFTVQLRLEERMFLGYMNQGKKLFAELNEAMAAAFEGGAKLFTWPLRLTALRGPGEFVVPVTIAKEVWERVRRRRDACVSALLLEIGPASVEVRVTLKRARATPDVAKRRKFSANTLEQLAAAVNARTHLLGRDVGMANTLAHALVRRDAEVSVERLMSATSLDKATSRAFLESHAHDESNVVRSWHWSGRGFLVAVNARAKDIDALRKRIDLGYKHLGELRRCLCKPLNLVEPEDLVPEDTNHPDPLVRHLASKFHRLLSRLRQLKAARIGIYRRVDAIKTCWFGFVTNDEVGVAVENDAAVVREDATFEAIQVDDPKYKGRTFNKLLNNGSRGRIASMASAKLAWAGVPEVVVPSYHTSSYDYRHSVVDRGMRRGERFKALDGKVWHSDEHACETVAQWLLLQPRATMELAT
jgi:hypothetical protein